MKAGNLYSASDKSIYDAINQSKVTKEDISELLFERATIASSKTKRERIADYYSTLFHDFYDYQKLSEILGSSSQREKLTSKQLKTNISLDDIENSVLQIIEEIENSEEAKLVTNKVGKVLLVHATYRTTNFNRSEFRQVVEKEATIEIYQEDDGFVIRHPNNPKVEEWNSRLIETLKENNEEKVTENEINLTHIPSSEKRSEFFAKLITEIDGFKLFDVTDVYVFHPKPKEEEGSEEERNTSGVHISKASLKGEQVLNSKELQNLFSRGFYISRISWSALKDEAESDKYIFEAQVSNPEDFSGFSYLAKGFHKRKSINEYTTSRSVLTSSEEKNFYKKLEIAARNICTSIISSYHQGDSENGPK